MRAAKPLVAALGTLTLGGCVLLYDYDTYELGATGGANGCGDAAPGPSTVELCTNDVDDDCDGTQCDNVATWNRRFGDSTYEQTVTGVAMATDGSVLVAGHYKGTIEIEPTKDVSSNLASNQTDAFIAKILPSGEGAWIRDLAGTLDRQVFGVAVDGMNAALVTGYIDEGAGATQKDAFVRRWFAQGAEDWTWKHMGGGDDLGLALAVGPNDAVFVAGKISGSGQILCGMESPTYTDLADALFVAKLNGGLCVWGYVFPGGVHHPTAITVDAIGNPVVTGRFSGALGTMNSQGEVAFVMSLNGVDGTPVWGKTFGDINNPVYPQAIHGGFGKMLVTGSFRGAANLGAETLGSDDGTEDTFVIALEELNGTPAWAKRFGGKLVQKGTGITVDPAGSIFVAGITEGAMSPEPSSTEGVLGNSHSMFLLALDGDGNPRWGDVFGAEEALAPRSAHVAWGPLGVALAAGWSTSIDFGNGPLAGASLALDIVVAKFPPL